MTTHSSDGHVSWNHGLSTLAQSSVLAIQWRAIQGGEQRLGQAVLSGESTGPILHHEYEIVENCVANGIRYVRATAR
jgi:hypothetical protein